MIRPEVVEYLVTTLDRYPLEGLKDQLALEGVSAQDIDDSIIEARKRQKDNRGLERKRRFKLVAKIFLGLGVAVILGVVVFALFQKGGQPGHGGQTDASTESAFIGQGGWIVRLPKDYVGIINHADKNQQRQTIYFCKKGTDPTNFINEGLFGQLGIVKLDVVPAPFPNNPTGLVNLSQSAAVKYRNAGEKYSLKTMQVATLPGIQVNVLSPFPRVEAYVLGQELMYFFSGGQEDEIWRDIVLSLRDTRTEN